MASRRPRKSVYSGKTQSLQGAFESSRCVCAVPALGRITEMLWNKCCCCSRPVLCCFAWDLGGRGGSVFCRGGRRRSCGVVGKFEFQIPVHLKFKKQKQQNDKTKLLFLIFFLLNLLAALAFQGRTLRGHCCLLDPLYGTVILMSLFSNHLYTKSFHEWLPYNFSTLIVNG